MSVSLYVRNDGNDCVSKILNSIMPTTKLADRLEKYNDIGVRHYAVRVICHSFDDKKIVDNFSLPRLNPNVQDKFRDSSYTHRQEVLKTILTNQGKVEIFLSYTPEDFGTNKSEEKCIVFEKMPNDVTLYDYSSYTNQFVQYPSASW